MASELEQDGGLPPQAMLTVAAVARRLGVAPSTLRTWDRRYGLGPSAHTAGSHRRYSPPDVSRLVVMRGLVMEGVPPAEAAQIALSSPVDSEAGLVRPAGRPAVPHSGPATDTPSASFPLRPAGAPDDSSPGSSTSSSASASSAAFPPAWSGQRIGGSPVTGVPVSRAVPVPEGLPGDAPAHRWPLAPLAAEHLLQTSGDLLQTSGDGEAGVGDDLDDVLTQVIDEALGEARPVPHSGGWSVASSGARAGGGRVISLPDASPRARGLARAAMSLDTHELSRLLREAVGAYGVVNAWNAMVLPVLNGLGERWQATGEGVDVEHAFAEATAGVLRGVTAALHRPRNVRPVLLACSEGDYHSLPLHVLAAALAEREVGCRMLGVGLPPAALVAATRRTGPAVVFMYARLPVADASALRDFPRQRPAPRILVGGPGWRYSEVPAAVLRVDSLQHAVDEVLAAVQFV